MLSFVEPDYVIKNEIIDSLPQASDTMTWSIISHNESEKMVENYIRIKTGIQNQRR